MPLILFSLLSQTARNLSFALSLPTAAPVQYLETLQQQREVSFCQGVLRGHKCLHLRAAAMLFHGDHGSGLNWGFLAPTLKIRVGAGYSLVSQMCLGGNLTSKFFSQ